MLSGYEFKSEYNTGANNPIFDFLLPGLERSLVYDRAVGFFSSGLLSVIPQAFSSFAEKGGKIRLVCSPVLNPNDAEALERLSTQNELISQLSERIDELDQPSVLSEPLDLLVALMRSGTLEIKFAIPYSKVGIHHQKMGVMTDERGSSLSFHGSNNESIFGWVQGMNYEEFLVFRDWVDESERDRVRKAKVAFDLLWNDETPGVDVITYSQGLRFIERREGLDLDLASTKSRVKEWMIGWSSNSTSKTKLRGYQKEVLHDWEENGYRGIISFATGVGKTKTALEGIRRWLSKGKNSVLIIVPDVRLMNQWLREIYSHEDFSNESVLKVGGGSQREIWENLLRSYTGENHLEGERLVIAVQDTARTEAFISRVSWNEKLLVVADEVHRLGEPASANLLLCLKSMSNLGLSATPDRYLDESGTSRIRETFGRDLEPRIDIAKAISMEILVPYIYRFCTVTLNEEEEEKYSRLSRQILILKSSAVTTEDYQKLTELQVARARVLKKAKAKVDVIAEIIRTEFRTDQHWLLYCEDTEQVMEFREKLKALRPLTYFQNSDGSHEETLKNFSKSNGGLLIAVQMLDEGIDIPALDHAFLIASSKNPRQYVQRRGRVLRKSEEKRKPYAHIWDVFVVDKDGLALDVHELDRGMNFSEDAFNKSVISDLRRISRSLSCVEEVEYHEAGRSWTWK